MGHISTRGGIGAVSCVGMIVVGDRIGDHQLLRKREIAAAISWLASDEASNITARQ